MSFPSSGDGFDSRSPLQFFCMEISGFTFSLVLLQLFFNLEVVTICRAIKNLRLKGGGGTSHKSCFNHLRDNVRDCKLAIFLTDGYSDINEISFENYQYDKLFVITKNGSDDQLKGKRCQIIHLKD